MSRVTADHRREARAVAANVTHAVLDTIPRHGQYILVVGLVMFDENDDPKALCGASVGLEVADGALNTAPVETMASAAAFGIVAHDLKTRKPTTIRFSVPR